METKTAMQKLIDGAAALGLALGEREVERFQRYYEELARWNERVNLTAITVYDDVQIGHFLDSLTVVLALDGTTPRRAVDVGSGAGFPGLPLKIVFSDMALTLVESVGKRARFLEHVIAALGLDGVSVALGRAETLARQPQHREGYDLALARGVAPLPTLLELTLPFCRLGGRLVAHRRGDDLAAATSALMRLGGAIVAWQPIELPGLADGRALLVVDKVAPTPDTYPRRVGIPARRPLTQASLRL